MLTKLIHLRNELQPKSMSNTDALQFDYKFWTELEKTAKKSRDNALSVLKSACDDPNSPGIILKSARFITILKKSSPIKAFDKEVFIEEIIKRCPSIPRHVLREAATAAVVETAPRSTYSVEDNDD